jgi:hypothetical protein
MERVMEGSMNRKSDTCRCIEHQRDHYRGGVCIVMDGVVGNGTARDELVDAEIEGAVRLGGLGEFFAP